MGRDPNTHEIYYKYQTAGEPLILSQRDCWHVPGFGYDGMQGYSLISLAREGIGLGMAAEEYGSRFFGQGASPGVVVRHPGKISPEAHQSMREDMQDKIEGLGKAHRLMLLEEGMEAQTLGMPHDDMQFHPYFCIENVVLQTSCFRKFGEVYHLLHILWHRQVLL